MLKTYRVYFKAWVDVPASNEEDAGREIEDIIGDAEVIEVSDVDMLEPEYEKEDDQ